MKCRTRIAFALLASLSLQAKASDETLLLQQTVQCLSQGEFQVIKNRARSSADAFRTVAGYQGPQTISVRHGRQLILATANGQPFVNLKVEISDPAQAEADRDKLRLTMQSQAEKRPAGNGGLRAVVEGKVETLSLDHDTLDSSLPGYHTLLDLENNRVITLHLLNQKDFRQYSDYSRARGSALRLAQSCLAAPH